MQISKNCAFLFFCAIFLRFVQTRELLMLILLPQDDGAGRDCQIATKIALNALNVNVFPIFRPENEAVRAVFEFAKNCSNKNCYSTIIGPFHDENCRAIGSLLDLFNFTATTPGCSVTKKNPNLFRTQFFSSDVQLFARLKFIGEIGNWSRLVVLTSRDSYSTSKIFKNECEKLHISVPIFVEISPTSEWESLTSALAEIKTSPFKILVVDFAETRLAALKFLCTAQAFGFTSDSGGYAFIFKWQTYFNPLATNLTLPPECNRLKLLDQFSTSFWIGDVILEARGLKSVNKTVLGYNLTEFWQKFTDARGFAQDNSESPYAGLVAFHDTLLLGLSTLMPQSPPITEIGFAPLANGGQSLKYSNLTEIGSQLQFIYKFNANFNSIEAIYQVKLLPGQPFDKFASYQISSTSCSRSKILLPEDSKLVIDAIKRVPVPAFVILCIFAIFLIIGQFWSFLVTGVTAILNNYQPVIETLPRSKCALLEGLLYMNIAAILIIVNDPSRPDLLCRFRWFFIILSTSRVHGLLVSKIACYYKRIRVKEIFPHLTLKQVVQKNDRFVMIGSTIFTTICIVLLLFWFILDPVRAELVPVLNRADLEKIEPGIFRRFLGEKCTSDYQPFWVALFFLLNVALLGAGSIFSFLTRGVRYQIEFGFSDIEYFRCSIWVSLINCVASMITIAALEGGDGALANAQMIALSSGLLISSLFVDSFIFFPNSMKNSREMFAILFRRQRWHDNSVSGTTVVTINNNNNNHQDTPHAIIVPTIVLSDCSQSDAGIQQHEQE